MKTDTCNQYETLIYLPNFADISYSPYDWLIFGPIIAIILTVWITHALTVRQSAKRRDDALRTKINTILELMYEQVAEDIIDAANYSKKH